MKKPKDVEAEKDATADVECEDCGGTGYPAVQTVAPGRRIYPGPCKKCGGKGRLTKPS
jgi:DnaJ-class molecular chaperone